jgi:tetratricopeptide (TPR) repeat protein
LITLEDAFAWLNRFDQKQNYLSDSSILLLERINQAQIAWDLETLRVRIRDLIAFCDSLKRELEPAEARLKCARAFFLLDDYWEAAPLLRQAISEYHPHRHNQAAAHWMLGYVLWQMPDQHEEAILEWNRSIEIFADLREIHRINQEQADWYGQRLTEMNKSIPQAIAYYGFP